jgi:hypothetical protein
MSSPQPERLLRSRSEKDEGLRLRMITIRALEVKNYEPQVALVAKNTNNKAL